MLMIYKVFNPYALQNVTYETYKNSCVRNMLHDQQKATIMRGVHIENGEKRHIFGIWMDGSIVQDT